MAVGAASGSLVVSLALNAAEFVSGLTKSEYEAKKWARNMEKVGKEAGQLLGVGFAAGATALFFLTKHAIDAATELEHLSEKTGVAVETLGGLGFAAKQSGSDIEGVANAFKKFNIHIAEGAAGNQDMVEAFKAIGISVKDLKTLSPDQILIKAATAFSGFADGPEKAAQANKVFGKSYQDIIPLLNQGGEKLKQSIEYFEKYSGVTPELTRSSKEFHETLVKLELLSGAFANTLAAELLPSLQGIANAFVDAKEKGDGFKSGAHDLAEFLKSIAIGAIYAATEIYVLGKGLGAAAAQLAALATDGVAAFKFLGAEADKEIDGILARRDKLINAIRNPETNIGNGAPSNRDKPRLPSLGSSDATDLAKKLLDQQLKQLENAIRREKELLADRQHYLDAYYQDNLITTEAYYAQKAAAEDRALRVTLDAYDKEIAAARAFAAKAKPADKIDAENKIADAIAKRQSAEEEGARKSFDLARQRQKDIDQYNDSVAELSAQVLLLSGREAEAAKITFGLRNRELRARIEREGGDTGPLDLLERQTVAQAALNSESRKYSTIQNDLGIAQARITLEQQSGAITELDAINKRSALTKEFVQTLTAEADAYERVAQSLEGTARDDALQKLKQMRLEIDQLSESANELANRFRDIFEGAFTDELTAVVTGTKSVSDAFKDMEKQIVASITRIAAKNIAESIFGTGTAGGGLASFLASLFGGGAGGGGGFGSFFSSLFGGGGDLGVNFASGGSPPIGRASIVGERGPELFIPKTQGTIIPNRSLRSVGGKSFNMTVNVLPGASAESADQAAASFGLAVRKASARNL